MAPRIAVTNLGPLRTAEIDLEQLTILIGANNTGKTFFATVLHRVIDSAATPPLRTRHTSLRELPRELSSREDGRRLSGDLERQRPLLSDDWTPQPDTVRWAREYLHDVLMDFAQSVRANIEYAFGVEATHLHRRTPSGRRARGGSCVCIWNNDPRWSVRVPFDHNEVSVDPPEPQAWLKSFVRQTVPTPGQPALFLDLFGGFLPGPTPGLFDGWPEQSVHLPAGRTGIMQSYQVLASSVVRQSAAAGIRPIEVPTLPGTAADFLSLLLALPQPRLPRPRRQPSTELDAQVKQLESEIGLAIELEESGKGVVEVVAVTAEGRYPLARTSSMVSELAPVLLVLRRTIRPGSQLVIDEPEAHLHPSMQRHIAKFFARLTAHGVRLVLTTHSDVLLGEINNLIRAETLGQRGRQLTFDIDEVLETQNVQALVFRRNGQGCWAERLPIDPIDGIDETTFAEVMTALYDESVALSSALDAVAG